MNAMINRAFFILMLTIYSASAAARHHTAGIGGVADNILEPVGVFKDFMHAAAFIVGASLIFASIIKYFEHRRSPLMVPMSTVVILFLLGAVAIALPLISMYYHLYG